MLRNNRPSPALTAAAYKHAVSAMAHWHDQSDDSYPGLPWRFHSTFWDRTLLIPWPVPPILLTALHTFSVLRAGYVFRRIYQSLQDTEEKCGTENNIKLLLEMPTRKGELALASKEMEILPHSSRVPEFPSSVFTDCPVLIPFMKWLKVGTAILVREWDTPIHP